MARLSEEHAHLTGEGLAALRPGQKVEVIPSHGDTTLNLHDWYNVTRRAAVIGRWPILGARKFKWAIMAVFPPGSPRARPDFPED